MLKIENLHVSTGGKKILKGITLEIPAGSVHAIMGPNGAGKSTLTRVLAGHGDYDITQGDIFFKGKSIKNVSIEERACMGIFTAFQYPVEIPGVNNSYFLRASFNAQRKYRNEPEMDVMDFMKFLKKGNESHEN